jgi:hypothetical protein
MNDIKNGTLKQSNSETAEETQALNPKYTEFEAEELRDATSNWLPFSPKRNCSRSRGALNLRIKHKPNSRGVEEKL